MNGIDTAALSSAWYLDGAACQMENADALKELLYDSRTAAFLPFDTKESYLAWVRAWKSEYKRLAAEIREEKAELRRPHTEETWRVFRARDASRAQARRMLVLRRLGKMRSWALKQAANASAA